jgi:carboxymethylenebutenolidase
MSDESSRFSAGMIDMESNTTLVQCYPAHQAVPAGEGPFPPVVVLHDRFGLNSHTRHVANRLAHEGFYALAPDFYGSPTSFAGSAPEYLQSLHPTHFDWSDESAARERAAGLTDDLAGSILEQAIAFVAGRSRASSGGVNLLGFGTGGRLAFLGACLDPASVRSAACFFPVDLEAPRPHGQPAPLERAEAISAPLLLLYGLLDPEIRGPEREAVRARLTALGKTFRIEVFREAGHDFFCEERDSYRIRASKTAWQETLALFRDGIPSSGAAGAGP